MLINFKFKRKLIFMIRFRILKKNIYLYGNYLNGFLINLIINLINIFN